MGLIELVRKVFPWIVGLSVVPKLILSGIILLIALFLLALIWTSTGESPRITPQPPANNSTPALDLHELACKLMWIQRAALRDFKAITPEMKSFVASNVYHHISDSMGIESFTDAFQSTRAAINARENGDAFNAGLNIAKANKALIRACSHYGFDECKDFVGKESADATKIFRALNALADCGDKLWPSKTLPTENGGSQLIEGSTWNMCGSTSNCDQTFPVTILNRKDNKLTLKMPLGTVDVEESQIKIVSLEQRILKILAK